MKQKQIKYLLVSCVHKMEIYKSMIMTFSQFQIQELEIISFFTDFSFQLVIPTSLESGC